MQHNKQYDVEHAKFENEPEYKDIKRANESGDNDIDRLTPQNDEGKTATDKAYIENQTGTGTSPSAGRQ